MSINEWVGYGTRAEDVRFSSFHSESDDPDNINTDDLDAGNTGNKEPVNLSRVVSVTGDDPTVVEIITVNYFGSRPDC
ncbi:hypothetical protein DKX38_028907 [Salix brachista]|uniref:Uncharacterized protein n=1 Tax=Salix brachista TaxID=2182728 RepID=A0A5N5IXT0_9ROSI|nr:hypothetical protein DKX38_028907 [Salix brachista]